jgi:hypothetical protein
LRANLEYADRFAAYVNELTKVLGHADREKPFRNYCAGLLATEGRRSVEPMAVVTDPRRVSVQRQKLLHLVADSPTHFGGLHHESDPISHYPDGGTTMTIQHRPANMRVSVPQCVSVRGGAYFFLPGIAALRSLAH